MLWGQTLGGAPWFFPEERVHWPRGLSVLDVGRSVLRNAKPAAADVAARGGGLLADTRGACALVVPLPVPARAPQPSAGTALGRSTQSHCRREMVRNRRDV